MWRQAFMCLVVFYVCKSLSNGFVCQAEDGIRYLVRSRGLGDVYKRQVFPEEFARFLLGSPKVRSAFLKYHRALLNVKFWHCLLYTSDAADERPSVDLGGRRIIKKKTAQDEILRRRVTSQAQKHNNSSNR